MEPQSGVKVGGKDVLRERFYWVDGFVLFAVATIGLIVVLVGLLCYGYTEVTVGDSQSDTPEWEVTMSDGSTYQVICYERLRWFTTGDAHSWDMKIIDPVSGNPTWIKYNPLNVVTIKRL